MCQNWAWCWSICVNIGSDSGFSHVYHHTIGWTKADLLWIRPWGMYLNEILLKNQYICFQEYAFEIIGFNMMMSSNGNIFRVTGPLCGEFTDPGEFPTQRPVTRSFDVFFDLCLNKRLSKQPWGWWFEMPSHPLWHQCNEDCHSVLASMCDVEDWGNSVALNQQLIATYGPWDQQSV